MSIWDTLGIDPTRDKREIKRAYAKMAACHHPEEEPEKFQEIYDAYEQAISYAEGYAGTEYHYEEVLYKEEPEPEPEISLGNNVSIQKSEIFDFYNKIPKTPRQKIVLKDSEEEYHIDFDEKIPKTPRQGLNHIENDQEARLDFEQLTSGNERKLRLNQPVEQTIHFQSIIKDAQPGELQHHIEPQEHTKKNNKMGRVELLSKCIVIVASWWFIWGLLQIFSGIDVDIFSVLKGNPSGQERVKRTLEQKYDTDFEITPIAAPDSMNEIYYLVTDGKTKEDYQWFECRTLDENVPVKFYASLDDSGAINYDYSYKQLFAFIYNVGLGGYLDMEDVQKNNIQYFNDGEKRYCYPILKLSSGNINNDFFQRLSTLSDMIRDSDAQFSNNDQLTINIKNSNNGGVYNFRLKKGKKPDMKTAEQEIKAFFGT